MGSQAKTHSKRAQSFIETVVGLIFLVPIVLALVDLSTIILGTTTNDYLAKQAARAAASSSPAVYATALAAAQNALTRNAGYTRGFITAANLEYFAYNGGGTQYVGTHSTAPTPVDPGAGMVAATTSVTIQPPVPFPFIGAAQIFFAKAVEPIVALPATPTTPPTP